MDIKTELGLRIKHRREFIGMNQSELAKKLGYKTPSSINKIESGMSEVPAHKVKDFANALDMEVSELVKGLGDTSVKYEHLIEESFGEKINAVNRYKNNKDIFRQTVILLTTLDETQLEKAYTTLSTMFGGKKWQQ